MEDDHISTLVVLVFGYLSATFLVACAGLGGAGTDWSRISERVAYLDVDSGGVAGTASGYLLDDQRIVTCRHSVQHMDRKTYFNVWIGGERYRARVDRVDSGTDLALVEIVSKEGSRKLSAPAADSRTIEYGTPVRILGYPKNRVKKSFNPAIHRGIVSGNDVELAVTKKKPGPGAGPFIELSAWASEGSSGSPLFTEDGKIIGIVSTVMKAGGSWSGFTYAVPWAEVARFAGLDGASDEKPSKTKTPPKKSR